MGFKEYIKKKYDERKELKAEIKNIRAEANVMKKEIRLEAKKEGMKQRVESYRKKTLERAMTTPQDRFKKLGKAVGGGLRTVGASLGSGYEHTQKTRGASSKSKSTNSQSSGMFGNGSMMSVGDAFGMNAFSVKKEPVKKRKKQKKKKKYREIVVRI